MTESLRLDRFLVYCRFARTRSKALAMIDSGIMRLNGERVLRSHLQISVGDTLTLIQGNEVRIIEVLGLPTRRGPPNLARSHYHELDRESESRIAASRRNC